MKMTFLLIYTTVLTAILNGTLAAGQVEFNRDVLPILSDNCFKCHGPDAAERKASLRLDVSEVPRSLLPSGKIAIVPGEVAASELIRRITSGDPAMRMPPVDSNKHLTKAQIGTLRSWIEQGGEYQPHWAYIALRKVTPPVVENESFVRNEIDRFILARLEEKGLHPSALADRVTLIRRISFDLTGLPPSAEQLDAFLSDDGADAYGNLVDRLLASPHYGERMAMHWLDLVRYADTVGYHGDQNVSVWPYRDYVVKAFNENMPFDRFTREQLAGDLIQDQKVDQKVASGYNRLLQTTEEGGAQAKEYLSIYFADRVRNLSSVWMGATVGCAQCHDHKFDPFTTKDFYSLGAFFADIEEQGVYGGRDDHGDARRPPTIILPDSQQAAMLEQMDAQLADFNKQLKSQRQQLAEYQRQWETSTLELLSSHSPRLGTWHAIGPFSVGEFDPTFEAVFEPERRIDLGASYQDGQLTWAAHPEWDNRKVHRLNDVENSATYLYRTVHVDKAQPLLLSLGSDDSIKVWHNGQEVLSRHVVRGAGIDQDRVSIDLEEGENQLLLKVVNGLNATGFYFKAFAGGFDSEVRAILETGPADRNAQQKEKLEVYYSNIAPRFRLLNEKIAKVGGRKAELLKQIPKTSVAVAVEPRTIRILPRGNWLDDSGPIVEPAIPEFMGSLTVANDRPNRLDLSNWLTDPDNPLTARVFVNRLWQLCFGTGLSQRLDDLGAQGQPPSHPLLLDHLAIRFVDSGWDIKQIHKLIVTSATYRQSSRPRPELAGIDPYNRLQARQVRFRIDAEMVRDNALSISGLLVPTIGGRSVKPYQPAGYYAQLNFPTRIYEADTGPGQYRRGLYTHWQRTFLHPGMKVFDAPTREECSVERPRSNTPLQALVLLNDPTFVEAARTFAERILREGGSSVAERIDWAYREAVSRSADRRATQVLGGIYRKHRSEYDGDRLAAKQLLDMGQAPVPEDFDEAELAAWTSVARVILNLHETITRY